MHANQNIYCHRHTVRFTCGCSVVSGDGRQAFAPNPPGRTLAPTPWQTSRPGWPGNHIIS